MKILVAEDNTMNQILIKRMLSKLGYSAEIADNGKKAVNMACENFYDLIFMDIQMPELSGIEAASIIVDELGSKAPMMVALTANVREEEKMEYAKVGMANVIGKPIDFTELENLLLKINKAAANKDTFAEKNDEKSEFLDPKILSQYTESGDEEDKKFYYGVIIDYEKSYITYKEKIIESLADGDFFQLKDIIHSFKGISYNIGAKKLGDFLNEVESACMENPFDINKSTIVKIEELFNKSIKLLKLSAK